jgi:hypothetical protein
MDRELFVPVIDGTTDGRVVAGGLLPAAARAFVIDALGLPPVLKT